MSQQRFGTDKDVKRIIDVARQQAWTVNMTRNNHIKFVPPDKTTNVVIYSLTSSDHRAFKNLKSQLRRSGLDIDH